MKNFTVDQMVSGAGSLGLRLIAGAQNRGNVITSVNIIDNPDSYDWLSAGEFVLTTGYLFQNDVGRQCQLIRELSEINCAGIGIKVKRYWQAVPACMIEEADRIGFPIIEIPFENTLAEVLECINRGLGEQDSYISKKYVHIHNTITQCTLQGGGLRQLVQLTGSLIGNPLLVVDSRWRLLAWSEREDDPQPMERYLRLQKGEVPFCQEFLESMPRDVERYAHSIKRGYPKSSIVCRILPVSATDISYGFLVVWETVRKMVALDYMALEMAATAVALNQVKEKQIQEVKHSLRQDFFDDLLEGKIESVNAVRNLAEIHYMDAARTYLCIVCKLNVELAESGTLKGMGEIIQIKKAAIALMESVANRHGRSIVAIQRGNLTIAFLLAERGEEREQPGEKTRQLAADIYEEICRQYPAAEMGVGDPCPDFLNLGMSYRNALEAMEISERIKDGPRLTFYADMRLYHLLELVQPREQLRDFVGQVLGRLQRHDEENHTDLVDTLDSYFQSGGNITLAARKKYLHRNTFMYRIEKIKDILQVDLKQPEATLELQVALRIRKLLAQQSRP